MNVSATRPARKRYTVADFRARAQELVHPPQAMQRVQDTGDHRLNPGAEAAFRNREYKDAAVLVGVMNKPDGPHVLLTQRTAHLRTHSGQIAFPGGKIDPEDAGPEEAAMRECEEETGISPEYVEVLGRLPDYMAGSGFRIVPVLAVINEGFAVDPNPHEVDAVFDVPLAFLMDEANHGRGSIMYEGVERFFYEMPYGDWRIWGVTAGIIRVMYERLYA